MKRRTPMTKHHMRQAARAAEREREEGIRTARKEALARLGFAGYGGAHGLVAAGTAAEILGVTPQALKTTLAVHIEPAEEAPNPYYSQAGAPMRLYCPLALERVRDLPDVVALRERRARRQGATQKALATKRARLEAHVATLTVTVPL